MNTTFGNLTSNMTTPDVGMLIFDKIKGIFSFSWSLSIWLTDLIFPAIPEPTRTYISSGWTIMQVILFIGFMSLLFKSFERITSFIRKWVIPMLLLIFVLVVIFGFMQGINLQSQNVTLLVE